MGSVEVCCAPEPQEDSHLITGLVDGFTVPMVMPSIGIYLEMCLLDIGLPPNPTVELPLQRYLQATLKLVWRYEGVSW